MHRTSIDGINAWTIDVCAEWVVWGWDCVWELLSLFLYRINALSICTFNVGAVSDYVSLDYSLLIVYVGSRTQLLCNCMLYIYVDAGT